MSGWLTKEYTNDKSCSSCHPGGKGFENASGNIADTINRCIKNAFAGEGLDMDSKEMKNITAYIKSFEKQTQRRRCNIKKFGEVFQIADWKKEKHVPLIECPDSIKSGEKVDIKVFIGKEVSHPNTTEHHISWIQVYFHPKGWQITNQLANCEFTAHGEAFEGPNKGPVYTDHSATITVTLNQPGTIYALSLCNIHGLWENIKEIAVQ